MVVGAARGHATGQPVQHVVGEGLGLGATHLVVVDDDVPRTYPVRQSIRELLSPGTPASIAISGRRRWFASRYSSYHPG